METQWANFDTGEEQGLYTWVAVNYALGTLGADPQETTGIIELGGASAQVLFIRWSIYFFFRSFDPCLSREHSRLLWQKYIRNIYFHMCLMCILFNSNDQRNVVDWWVIYIGNVKVVLGVTIQAIKHKKNEMLIPD